MTNKAGYGLAALLAVALLLGGCGGGDGDSAQYPAGP